MIPSVHYQQALPAFRSGQEGSFRPSRSPTSTGYRRSGRLHHREVFNRRDQVRAPEDVWVRWAGTETSSSDRPQRGSGPLGTSTHPGHCKIRTGAQWKDEGRLNVLSNIPTAERSTVHIHRIGPDPLVRGCPSSSARQNQRNQRNM